MYDPDEWAVVRSTGLITFPKHFRNENELIAIATKTYKKDFNGAKEIADTITHIDGRIVHDLVIIAKISTNDNNVNESNSLIRSLISTYDGNNRLNYFDDRFLTLEEELNRFIILVQFVLNDYNLLNDLLNKGKNQFNLIKNNSVAKDNIKKIITQCDINPFMLDDDNYNLYLKGHIDRINGDKDYLKHKKLINELKYQIPLPDYSHLIKNVRSKQQLTDYSKPSEPLFWHNGILYHGNREKVYNSIIFLKESIDILDFSDDHITLGGSLPPYLINIYIDSCHTGSNKLNRIAPGDIIQFIKFIDQYPTQTLSINKLEFKILEYFENEEIVCGSELDDICDRYKLKLLYLYLHNEKMSVKVP